MDREKVSKSFSDALFPYRNLVEIPASFLLFCHLKACWKDRDRQRYKSDPVDTESPLFKPRMRYATCPRHPDTRMCS